MPGAQRVPVVWFFDNRDAAGETRG